MKRWKWEFMNTWDEWHAFVVGWGEVVCPWVPRFSVPTPFYLEPEYHYYLFGRAIGSFTFVGIFVAIWRLLA